MQMIKGFKRLYYAMFSYFLTFFIKFKNLDILLTFAANTSDISISSVSEYGFTMS